MLWFESLLFYGCEEREQEREDVDIALLPTIVEKVILPKLTGRARYACSSWAVHYQDSYPGPEQLRGDACLYPDWKAILEGPGVGTVMIQGQV